jgi:hypothetical protein
MSAEVIEVSQKFSSESDTTNINMQSVEWGWRGRTSREYSLRVYRPTRGEETSSPQEAQALPAHRHLGASSHSGNARGGCRGCISLDRDNT